MTDSAANSSRVSALLRRQELDIRRRLDGILHGQYQGLVPGHGSELGEARHYMPGDDIRRIDWSVSARSIDLHVRDTIADRELETWLVVDRSASLDFGTALHEKRELAVKVASGIGFLASRGGNRIGAVIGGPHAPQRIPARGGRKHLLSILERIDSTERLAGKSSVEFGDLLKNVAAIGKRRGFVVVISDFLDPIDGWKRQLGALNIRHQVLAVEISDPRELELPNVGIVEVTDPETGECREVNTSSRRFREEYAHAAQHQLDEIATAIRSTGAHHLPLSTGGDWLGDLSKHISQQRKQHVYGAHR